LLVGERDRVVDATIFLFLFLGADARVIALRGRRRSAAFEFSCPPIAAKRSA
jgi:hypothetical protein